MASEQYRMMHSRVLRTVDSAHPAPDHKFVDDWRRGCGCLRTSDKLKEILRTFPSPPPPTPTVNHDSIAMHCQNCHDPTVKATEPQANCCQDDPNSETLKVSSRSMQIVHELVQLVQLSVTATALALYYLIYCYMQLVYYTLRSALYFHQADGPMKITIGVVTLTSLVVGFNLVIRIEKLIGFF